MDNIVFTPNWTHKSQCLSTVEVRTQIVTCVIQWIQMAFFTGDLVKRSLLQFRQSKKFFSIELTLEGLTTTFGEELLAVVDCM